MQVCNYRVLKRNTIARFAIEYSLVRLRKDRIGHEECADMDNSWFQAQDSLSDQTIT